MKYKDRINDLTNFVLLQNGNVIGTFGNLKKVADFLNGEQFCSYWTLARKKDFPVKCKNYTIFKVKHY